MRKPYYLFNPGRLERQDNTLKFTPRDEEGREGQPRFLPIEGVDALYVFGALDANSALYNFLGKAQISVHFFDWYEHYTGSFMPKDYLLAGWNTCARPSPSPECSIGCIRSPSSGQPRSSLPLIGTA